MKTTLEIPDSLFQEAKAYAEARGVPFRQVVEEGIRSVVERGRTSKTRFRLRDGSFGGKVRQDRLSWTDVRQAIYQGRGE